MADNKNNAFAALILFGGGFAIYKGVQLLSSAFKDTYEQKKDKLETEIKDLPVDNNKLQFLPVFYTNLANAQYNAMNLPGTDEKTLLEIIDKYKFKNEDLKALYKAFGLRTPNININLPVPRDWFDYGEASDLINWYKEELEDSPKDLQRMRNFWSGTGLWK
jgi:hypothetical protein